jgi:hypothetical protein
MNTQDVIPISVSFLEGDVFLVQLADVFFLGGVLQRELVNDARSVELLGPLFEPGWRWWWGWRVQVEIAIVEEGKDRGTSVRVEVGTIRVKEGNESEGDKGLPECRWDGMVVASWRAGSVPCECDQQLFGSLVSVDLHQGPLVYPLWEGREGEDTAEVGSRKWTQRALE